MDVTITGLQNTPVSASAPTDGQILTYIAANNDWEPKNVGSALSIDGQGYLFLPCPMAELSLAQSSGSSIIESSVQAGPGANNIYCIQFVCPFNITVNKVSTTVSTAQASSTAYEGIYSADGNTLLIQANFNTATATTVSASIISGSGTVLKAGTAYWLASANSNNSVRVCGITPASAATALVNANTLKMGSAANSVSSGVMPSSLGVISVAGSLSIPAILIEP